MEHTSLPWRPRDNGLEISSDHDLNGGVAVCHLRVNAAFIVRAVNNHYQLLEALEKLASWAEGIIDNLETASPLIGPKLRREVLLPAREAIEEARK